MQLLFHQKYLTNIALKTFDFLIKELHRVAWYCSINWFCILCVSFADVVPRQIHWAWLGLMSSTCEYFFFIWTNNIFPLYGQNLSNRKYAFQVQVTRSYPHPVRNLYFDVSNNFRGLSKQQTAAVWRERLLRWKIPSLIYQNLFLRYFIIETSERVCTLVDRPAIQV